MSVRYNRKKQEKKRRKLVTMGVVAFSGLALWSCQPTGEPEADSSSKPLESASVSSSVLAESSAVEPEISERERLEAQLVATPEAHSSDWNLILINRNNRLDGDLPIEFHYAANGLAMDARIQQAYEAMIADGRAQGLDFILVSAYRSIAQQEANYWSQYNAYINSGYSEAEAKQMTEDYIALPDASEHSTGLALDISNPEMYAAGSGGLVEAFEDTAEGQWLHENAADYGFILRYPRGKEEITMIQYESWHFRYVGVENAQYMYQNELTLEEYVAILRQNEAVRSELAELE